MKTTLRRAAKPGLAVLALSVALTACSAANEEGDTNATGSGDDTGSSLSGTLNGAGASSQEAAMGAWRAGFQSANSGVTVNYDPVGSGGGREQFISGGVQFAGTDSLLDAEELSAAAEQCGADPIIIPSYVSPIAIIYNIDGVDDLKLDGATLAGIFAGEITKWNDPAIVATNPDADLPDADITAVHRADDSGTTDNFTAYLDAVAPDVWTHGEVGEWPITHGEAAPQTSGVVSAVTNGQNTIGYADASQAGDLGQVEVQVGEDFVGPSAEAAAKVLEVSPKAEGQGENAMAYELARDTAESGAYPIVLTSYLLACESYADANQAELVKGFLTYLISDEGQQAAADAAGSAPLSDALVEEAEGLIAKIGS